MATKSSAIHSLHAKKTVRGAEIYRNVFVSLEFFEFFNSFDDNFSSFLQDVDCQNPPPITNGTVTLSTNATYYGAAALYECFPKFKLDGVSRRLCSEDGTWGHDTPMCVEITCPIPDVNEHLIVDAGKRLVGESAKFTCSKGRYLVGNSTRFCTPEGKWAGKNPVCKREFLYFLKCSKLFNFFVYSHRLSTTK